MTSSSRCPFLFLILVVGFGATASCAVMDAVELTEQADADVVDDADEASPSPPPKTELAAPVGEASAAMPMRAELAPVPTVTAAMQSVSEPELAPFVVHEWGTYTAIQGSDGVTLEGVHATEERLPSFVWGRKREATYAKSVEFLPEPVTQKLETPVIYFYADREHGPREAVVEVDFPDGIISEWYPDSTVSAPPIGSLEHIADGSMRWEIELLRDEGEMREVAPDSVWAPSRRVPDALQVQAKGERERFIFYRGLGRFEVPVTVTQTEPGGPLHVHNASDDALAAVFLLHVDERGRGGSFQALGALTAGAQLDVSIEARQRALDEHVDLAADAVAAALVDSGLYPDEARAMVDTWRHSYFATPGLRVLYVAPQSWADALLPLRVEPAPDEIVRTLVGRIDVLTVDEEQDLLDQITALRDSRESARAWDPVSLGRFAEPKLRRIQALSDDPWVDALCDDYIFELADPWGQTRVP